MKDGGDISGRKRLHFAPEKGLIKMKKNGSSTIYCITILQMKWEKDAIYLMWIVDYGV